MMKQILRTAAVGVLAAAGCTGGQETPMPTVDGGKALDYVREFVRIGPRASDTEGARRAARYLQDSARELGWEVFVDTWSEDTDNGEMTFSNVHAVLPGKGEDFVLLGSHYDTKHLPEVPNFVGANDSGSSTGLLLALMEVLAENPPKHTVECVFFDGEESRVRYTAGDGLHGSRHHVKKLIAENRLERCRALLLMDMVGDRDLDIRFPPSSSAGLVGTAFEIAERQGVREHFGYRTQGDILDDHIPFARQGVRVINFIDFEFGPNNSHWHTKHDTLDKIDAESLEIVGNVVLELTYDLAGR